MAKSVKSWLIVRRMDSRTVSVEGSATRSGVGKPGNSECWLFLSDAELDWLINELIKAKVKVCGRISHDNLVCHLPQGHSGHHVGADGMRVHFWPDTEGGDQ